MNNIKFWDDQILKWEHDQYDLLPKLGLFSGVQNVQQEAFKVMLPILKNCSVVEYGCGTGRLMAPILDAGAAKYIGVDSSTTAIQTAQNRVTQAMAHKVDLICSPIAQMDPIPMDFSFSLFLLDWVNPQELIKLSAPLFLHSFRSATHPASLFSKVATTRYGASYKPAVYSNEDLKEKMNRTRIKVHESPKTGAVRFIHNLL